MYWYISFLRPPTVTAPISGDGITITPQVANDLRTELRYDPTDIHYTWQRLLPTPLNPEPAQELTMFIPPGSTYKPTTVPLPARAQVGESWRLGLFSPPYPSPSPSGSGGNASGKGKNVVRAGPVGSLLDLVLDPQILGVWSEGIQIARPAGGLNSGAVRGMGKQTQPDASAKGKGKGKGQGGKEKDDTPKQGRILREWTLPIPMSSSRRSSRLRIVEQTSFDLDKKIWDSGLALSAWFWKNLSDHSPLPPLGRTVLNLLTRQDSLRVVELGSGTGLVSIALSLANAHLAPRSSWSITSTDLESAIPLMDENLMLNPVPVSVPLSTTSVDGMKDREMKGVKVDAKVLDWDERLPDWVEEDRPELIIAADVTYNTSAFPSLLSTLTSLLLPSPSSAGIHKSRLGPLLVLAYKQRDPGERELWDMLKEKGIEMVMIDQVQGSEDYGTTEIWVGGANLS